MRLISLSFAICGAFWSMPGKRGRSARDGRLDVLLLALALPLLLPRAQLILGGILGDAIALLDLAHELIALAGDDVQVVVGELAPTLANAAAELLPIALRPDPNSRSSSSWV
jgi:hypothetical protein